MDSNTQLHVFFFFSSIDTESKYDLFHSRIAEQNSLYRLTVFFASNERQPQKSKQTTKQISNPQINSRIFLQIYLLCCSALFFSLSPYTFFFFLVCVYSLTIWCLLFGFEGSDFDTRAISRKLYF